MKSSFQECVFFIGGRFDNLFKQRFEPAEVDRRCDVLLFVSSALSFGLWLCSIIRVTLTRAQANRLPELILASLRNAPHRLISARCSGMTAHRAI